MLFSTNMCVLQGVLQCVVLCISCGVVESVCDVPALLAMLWMRFAMFLSPSGPW